MTDSRHDRLARLPPRVLPLLDYGIARLALLAALGAIVLDPIPVAASFYHVRMLAIVHLITLGWLTCSIPGSVYTSARSRCALPWRRGPLITPRSWPPPRAWREWPASSGGTCQRAWAGQAP